MKKISIEEKIVLLLEKNNYHISFAESMTGGMLASTIVNVSGASNVLDRSFITYSNISKHEILGVSLETIEKYDVVSIPVVLEMVEGLYNITNAQICVSVSGYANGYLDNKGKVCYAIRFIDKITTNEVIIDGNRNQVRIKATHMILKDVYKLIKGV